jgi:Fur family zinc uptake transcriptional regulator
MSKHSQSIAAILKKFGLKKTAMRTTIFDTFQQSQRPLSVLEIQKKHPKLDKVGIYRTIHTYLSFGILKEVQMRHKHAHYEFSLDKDDHHHIICTNCGCIEEIPTCPAQSILSSLPQYSKHFSFLSDHSFEIFGICRKCS